MDNDQLTPENVTDEEKKTIKDDLLEIIKLTNRSNDSLKKAIELGVYSDTYTKEQIEYDIEYNNKMILSCKEQLDYYNIPYTEEEINNR